MGDVAAVTEAVGPPMTEKRSALTYFVRWGLISTALYALVAYGGVALLLWLGGEPSDAVLYRSLLAVGAFFLVVSAVMFAGVGVLVGWVARQYPDVPRPLLARATVLLSLVLGGALGWWGGGVLLPLVVVLAVLCWRWWR